MKKESNKKGSAQFLVLIGIWAIFMALLVPLIRTLADHNQKVMAVFQFAIAHIWQIWGIILILFVLLVIKCILDRTRMKKMQEANK